MDAPPDIPLDLDPGPDALRTAIRSLCAAWNRGDWTPAHDAALAALVPGAPQIAARRRAPEHGAFAEGCRRYQDDPANAQLEPPEPPDADELARLRRAVLRYLGNDGQDLCWEHVETLRRVLPECGGLPLTKPDRATCRDLCDRYRAAAEAGLRRAEE